ncbi:hypothetical protein SLEP1_g7940 [Rubroshorea leprosula]|uniref:Uncharacterized protein n=1 Tax=Rubroshorea leprosula TaxID=152421 RepID=A0AAV5I803_9ROSI|nr:hypothetical protein SLEP1_g7940 [Rubroshorea leprosula]
MQEKCRYLVEGVDTLQLVLHIFQLMLDLYTSCSSSALRARPLQLVTDLGSECLSSTARAQVLHFVLDLGNKCLSSAARALQLVVDLSSSCFNSALRARPLKLVADLGSSCLISALCARPRQQVSCLSSALRARPLKLVADLGCKCLNSAAHAQVLHFVLDLGSKCVSSTARCHGTRVRGPKSRASWHGAAATGTQEVCASTGASGSVDAGMRERVLVSRHEVATTTRTHSRAQAQGGSLETQWALSAEASIPGPWREVVDRTRGSLRKQSRASACARESVQAQDMGAHTGNLGQDAGMHGGGQARGAGAHGSGQECPQSVSSCSSSVLHARPLHFVLDLGSSCLSWTALLLPSWSTALSFATAKLDCFVAAELGHCCY